MTSGKYKAERQSRGTQANVAALLGTTQVTLSRREQGVVPITKETELALLSLPKKKLKAAKKTAP
jgi:hypothetical protein